MIKSVTSRDNSLLRLARAVRDGKNTEYIFVEGLRLCEEALRSALELEAVIVSEELLRKERAATTMRQVRWRVAVRAGGLARSAVVTR